MDTPAPHTQINQAIRELSEARSLLAALILSSESFDYPKAKQTLGALERKIRELARVEAQLRAELTALAAPNVLAFPVER
jgi:hypothetical protein